ncbi:hypothetical protein JEQ12_020322 [Ovis aries]|uniref:40S ribosomal protein S3a n=2 Tax=Ovis TaxID=9935 RepID=A0A836CSI7_SHEEP|nr:hypothetical protein JEQ12_020322 [Ovis aries]
MLGSTEPKGISPMKAEPDLFSYHCTRHSFEFREVLSKSLLNAKALLVLSSTMAVSKNKHLMRGGKKGAKKKVVVPFPKRDWYDVKASVMFNIRNIGKTLVMRTQETKITSDGLKGRVFEIQKTSYAQHQQVYQIHKKMMEIMTQEVQTNDLKEVVNKLIPDSIGKDIEKACQSIYLLHDVFVRKVKMLKKPKFELGKLMELHGEASSSGKAIGDETGAKVE